MGNLRNNKDTADFTNINESMIDILAEDSPRVEINIHLNRAYIKMHYPTSVYESEPIYKVSAVVKRYGENSEGDIDLNNLLETNFYQFVPGVTMYAENQYNPPELPPFTVFYDIQNYWYVFEFRYMYIPSATVDGGNMFFSLVSKYVVDNRYPQLYKKYIGPYFINDLKNAFQTDRKLNIWYEVDNSLIVPSKYDLIKPQNSPSFKQVSEIYENDPIGYQIQIPKRYSLEFGTILIRDQALQKSIYEYFDGQPPENGDITIVFKYNQYQYNINIVGNLKSLISDYINSLIT